MNGRPRVVVTRRIFPHLIDELARDFDVDANQTDAVLTAAELAARLREADGALLTPGERVDEALLAACARLKVASNIAVGFNNLDLAACSRHGVCATNTPEVLNEATADHAWALLLAAARRVGESERWLRAGHWQRWSFEMFLGADLHGATLGVLGLGRIGRAIARRAQGFGMQVLYHNRHRLQGAEEGGARWVAKEELLRAADHLVVAVPGGSATQHLIGAAELALMKRSAVLVNVALTPHIASSTRATRAAMARLAMRNLADVLAGRRPAALLNPDVWDTRRK